MSKTNPRPITATAYLVLVPSISGRGDWSYVSDLRVDRVRSNRPTIQPGEIAIKVRLTFNETSLLESIPVVDVNVGDFTVSPPEPELVEVGAA